jgi:Flp pilus assembly pilin Flp
MLLLAVMFFKKISFLVSSQIGASLPEYALLLSLIAAALIFSIEALSKDVSSSFSITGSSLVSASTTN